MVGLVWMARTQRLPEAESPLQQEANAPAYAFEANDIQLQQMTADGALLYQVEARRVAQAPDDGRIDAADLTLHYDPPGAGATGHRWTVTADRAELPAAGNLLTLAGNVLARGTPAGSTRGSQLRTDRLRYDLATQDLGTDAAVEFVWGRNRLQGRGLRANIKQGSVAIESQVHGQLSR
jgi:LPS export ABC transporter protein LptC